MFNQCITALKGVLAINSVEDTACEGAPFGMGVNNALLYTLNQADQLGFNTRNGDGYYGLAEIGSGELFAVLGHLDTVPIGKDWTKNPLGEIDNNILYGRGVLDDKGPMYACLFATAELLNQGLKPTKRIRFIFGCDEESGWQCMDKYVSKEEIPSIAFTPDGDFPVINCEKGIVYYDVSMPCPSGIKAFCGGDRPNMVMDYCQVELQDSSCFNSSVLQQYGVELCGNTLIAKGKSAHGSQPQKGDNAFFKIVKLLANTLGKEWLQLDKIVCNYDGSGYDLKISDQVSGKLTVNIGTAKLDSDNNLHFSLDIRYPIAYDKPYIASQLKKSMPNFVITETFCHNSLFVDKNNPLVKSLLQSYIQITGEEACPISIGGGTYARALPCAVAFGPIFPGQESTIHQKDEQVSLDDFKKMYDIYKLAIKTLAF